MESFCPLCAKSGIRSRVKAFQINLEEAVWGCESEECSWPIGHEELIFFPRLAISCNWDDPTPVKEKLSALTELSLYTPPVTPGELSKESTEIVSAENVSSPPMEDAVGILSRCELLTSSNEFVGFSKSPLVELLQGDINSATKDRNVTNEQIMGFRTLPKFIEKTNTNHIFLSNINECCVNKKIQEHEHSFVNAMDTFKNLDVSDNAFTEFGVSVQQNTGNERSECSRLRSDAGVNGVETNFGTDSLPETLVNLDVTNNLNTTNESTMTSSSIDMLLEDILNDKSTILMDTNNDWLDMLMS